MILEQLTAIRVRNVERPVSAPQRSVGKGNERTLIVAAPSAAVDPAARLETPASDGRRPRCAVGHRR
ncbi:hypothetical protein C486_04273 [Natrinema gari JCM 14663]|uniref:Uncharacterized protein n=1 Tax=Natrinema gari JCM 14663 TaxID=1230459 RepID=L9Z9H0_9EURY|nr:hypothetical protein C486_04273 [Natrinema gari JCM 14663]